MTFPYPFACARRHYSFQSNRRSASLDANRASTDRRRRIQREAALSAHAANDRALLLLSGHKGVQTDSTSASVFQVHLVFSRHKRCHRSHACSRSAWSLQCASRR